MKGDRCGTSSLWACLARGERCLTRAGNVSTVCLFKEEWERLCGPGMVSPDFSVDSSRPDGKQPLDMEVDGFSCSFSLWHHAAGWLS